MEIIQRGVRLGKAAADSLRFPLRCERRLEARVLRPTLSICLARSLGSPPARWSGGKGIIQSCALAPVLELRFEPLRVTRPTGRTAFSSPPPNQKIWRQGDSNP